MFNQKDAEHSIDLLLSHVKDIGKIKDLFIKSNHALLNILMEKEDDKYDEARRDAILKLTYEENLERIKLLVKDKYDIDQGYREDFYKKPVYTAIKTCNLVIVEYFLSQSINVNFRFHTHELHDGDFKYITPLDYAYYLLNSDDVYDEKERSLLKIINLLKENGGLKANQIATELTKDQKCRKDIRKNLINVLKA